MKSLFGPNRRKVLGRTFLNVFTLLSPLAISTDLFAKYALPARIGLWFFIILVLTLGWLVTPGEKEPNKEGD